MRVLPDRELRDLVVPFLRRASETAECEIENNRELEEIEALVALDPSWKRFQREVDADADAFRCSVRDAETNVRLGEALHRRLGQVLLDRHRGHNATCRARQP